MSMPHSRYKGFTLVELLVALGLFSVIMTIASGAYLIMISATREAQAITNGINNLSYAIDSMARNINTGSAYSCNASDNTASDTFSFKDQRGVYIEYNVVSVASGQYRLQQKVGSNSATPFDVTDPSVIITSPDVFYCSGTSRDDNDQAHVTLVLQGEVEVGKNRDAQTFFIQTGATMRGTDL